MNLSQIILLQGNGCTKSKQRFRSGEKDKTEWSKKLSYMKKNIYIYLYFYIYSTITPKKEWKTARQKCINSSILQVPLCYTLKVQNNIINIFVYDIMLYTCTRVEYTCSIDVEDIVAYNNTHQKIY